MKIYGMEDSGNCYKPCLLLDLLGEPYEWVSVDITKGESRTDEFLGKNLNGRVPVLEIEPGTYLPESNAQLCYLADGTAFLPDDRVEKARVLQWLFFEQYSHEPFIATSRYWRHILKDAEGHARQLEERRPGGIAALGVMEEHLEGRDWFVGDRPTIADLALYAYTHVADEGGFALDASPRIRAWLERLAALPGYAPMRRIGG